MRARLAKINRMMATAKAKLGQVRLATLPEQLRRYAETGERPGDELAQSFITLSESALRAMDSSIGRDDHDQACAEYEKALGGWREVLRGAGL